MDPVANLLLLQVNFFLQLLDFHLQLRRFEVIDLIHDRFLTHHLLDLNLSLCLWFSSCLCNSLFPSSGLHSRAAVFDWCLRHLLCLLLFPLFFLSSFLLESSLLLSCVFEFWMLLNIGVVLGEQR